MSSNNVTPISTADIYDAYPESLAVCDLQFRSFGAHPSFHGPAETLFTFEDHAPVLSALSMPGDGRVLVVDAGGSLRVGVMGDRLAAIGANNGWAGVVIRGAVRDSLGMADLPIGVKALGTTARRGANPGEGRRGVRITFGGVVIAPGYWIFADQDAVTVSATELDLDAIA